MKDVMACRAGRLICIVRILESRIHGIGTTQLSSELEEHGYQVDQRTVQRDLKVLQATGLGEPRPSEDPAAGRVKWHLAS